MYHPSRPAPRLSKDRYSSLQYHRPSDKWRVVVEGAGEGGAGEEEVVGEYSHDELRISIVYRARCFGSAEEMQTYHSNNMHR